MHAVFFEWYLRRPIVYLRSLKDVSIPHLEAYSSFNSSGGYLSPGRFVITVS
jgi:hypothetical protein